MLKSQQCTVCFGMFESKDGRHKQHQKELNTTPKGTKMQWICNTCLEKQKKDV